MSPKYTAKERLKLIEKVILGNEPVARVCRDAGISRVLFYRWLKKYKETPGIPQVLTPGRPPRIMLTFSRGLRPRVGGAHIRGKQKPKILSPEEKLQLIRRVEAGEEVADVCREVGICRTIFYRWKKRYEQVPVEEKLEALQSKERHLKHYWRQTPEKYEQAVLNLVIQRPEYGIRKLVANLPQVAGVPIVGHHGVQNILRRHNLSLYEQRLAYAQAQATPVTRLITSWEQSFARFFTLPVELRQTIIRFVGVTALTMFSTVIVLGILGYFATVFGQAAPISRPGLIFATIALLVGMVFFLYSMKYYFTLALVLSFSTQSGEVRVELGKKNGNGHGWLGRIFGLNGSSSNGFLRGSTSGEVEPPKGAAGGLQANLDHIKLERHPFISIHLPFYNESKVANRILAACTSMDYENYEVIVCDDSTDETTQIVKEWEKHPQVKVLHRPTREGFKGGALKYALQAMDPRTEFVIVFDADFVPYPDTLTQFMKYFKATGGWKEELSYEGAPIQTMPYSTNGEVSKEGKVPNVSKAFGTFSRQEQELLAKNPIAVVAGYQWHVLNKSENWITRGVRTEYAGSYVIERPGQEILGAMKIIHGSVYCARADVLKHFGWGTSITEDYELTLRIYEKGFKVVFTPYIQAPSECVSTIKRLIRQRMRWAEGHSFNTRKMFWKLLFGRWEVRSEKLDTEVGSEKENQNPNISLQNPASHLQRHTSKRFIPSPLTLTEKLEFLYLAPYYLQAFLFLLGTFSWLVSETIFHVRLPFWTSLWGWSLVLTNFFALPLLNAVGLFLEESEEKDYLGLLSFVALCYIVTPFQAYAAVKGFLEPKEGPWFRTPKTGKITDIFTRGRFYRWLAGILPGRQPVPALQTMVNHQPSTISHYLSLATANNRFVNFKIRPKRLRWVSKIVLTILLIFSISLYHLSFNVSQVMAAVAGTMYVRNDASTLTGSWLSSETADSNSNTTTIASVPAATGSYQYQPGVTNSTAGTPGTITGKGWLSGDANGVQINTGTWSFTICETDNRSGYVGYLRVLAWKVQENGSSITASSSIYDSNTAFNGTDIWNGGVNNDTFTSASITGFTFDATYPKLYVEYWNVVTTTSGSKTSTFVTGTKGTTCSTSDPQIVFNGGVVVPEKLIFLATAAPFIPMMVLWIKKRRGLTLIGNADYR